MTGPAQEWAAEAATDRTSGGMRGPARGRAGKFPTVRLGAGLSDHEAQLGLGAGGKAAGSVRPELPRLAADSTGVTSSIGTSPAPRR